MSDTDLLAKVTQARKRLLLDYPWFGTLALMLKVELSDKPKHAAHTDGTFIRFRPDYVEKATIGELVVLWAHEIGHVAFLHPYRRGHRDLKECNIAGDYAVNGILKKAGMEIPSNWLYDPQYDDMSMESIYAKRHGQKQEPEPQNPPPPPPQGQQGKQQPAPGAGQPQPQPGQPQPGAGQPQAGGQPSDDDGQPGEFGDAPPEAVDAGQGKSGKGLQSSDTKGLEASEEGTQPSDKPGPKMTAEDWKIATEQATRVCQKAGNDPGAAGRAAKATHEPDTDWRGELQEFVEHQQPSDYSWASPNRRHIASGLYLPGIHKENLGTIAVGIDVSGSISKRLFDLFASHLQTILQEARPEKILVVYWDTEVQAVEEFTPDDFEATLHTTGGGGTRPQCLFDHLATLDEPPVALINFTDLDFYQKPTEPEYPVIWVTGVQVRKTAPWGKTLKIDAWGN